MEIVIPPWLVVMFAVYTMATPFLVGLALWYISQQRPDDYLMKSAVKGYEMGAVSADRASQALSATLDQYQNTMMQVQETHDKNTAALERQLMRQMQQQPQTMFHYPEHLRAPEPTNGQAIVPPDAVEEPENPLDSDRIKAGDM